MKAEIVVLLTHSVTGRRS